MIYHSKKFFSRLPVVTVASGRGAQGIKFGKKMFTMFYNGDLLVKLSPERVNERISFGDALPYDPGTGKPMKDRALMPALSKDNRISCFR